MSWKRVFVVLGLSMLALTSAFAQCVEVKGVETRKVNEYSKKNFEFNNLNKYTVTIEAELRRPSCIGGDGGNGDEYVVLETKSIVLDEKEQYTWEVSLSTNTPCGYKDTYLVFKVWKCP